MSNKLYLLFMAGLSITISSFIYIKYVKKRYIKVGIVKELLIYPIKGCKPVFVNKIIVTKHGLKTKDNLFDRSFVVLNNKNEAINMQNLIKISTIQIKIGDNCLILNGTVDPIPEKPLIVQIKHKLEPTDQVLQGFFKKNKFEGIYCGDEASQWLSDYLGTNKLKLIQHLPDLKYRPADSVNKHNLKYEKKFNILYQNYTDLHLICQSSLLDLNKKITENSGESFQVNGYNFRPNVIVSDTLEPWYEDKWQFIRINKTLFVQIENCFRCFNTTVKDNGKSNKEPLYTLRKFRRSKIKSEDARVNTSPFFGCLLGTLEEGEIQVNDSVEAIIVNYI